MGLFGRNIKKVIHEFKNLTQYYSNDLGREIDTSFKDLKADYEETSTAVSEFSQFVDEVKHKLDSSDARKLEAFKSLFTKLNRSARNGVEAMHELSRNQRKLSSENLHYFDEYE